MTELLVQVLAPYSTFLRYQDRRRKRDAELTFRDPPPTTAAEVPPVPINQPRTPEDCSLPIDAASDRPN